MAPEETAGERAALEQQISAYLRVMTAESEQIGRAFAAVHDVRPTDFRALLHVMVAETAGDPVTSGELRQRMGLSGAAITYLVDRMMASGHITRESDPADRRKVILRYSDSGLSTARAFFAPLGSHSHDAMTDLPDADLMAAGRVFAALIEAMRRYQDDLASFKPSVQPDA
ncbi:MarR family winged helix-turn-helix transcriptional regulator [Candidatus Mycobacterium wuenschmannii]|uniref:MarR family winged helix-turn-helix transcriptional regulator n=1 Tax=Candidatus Mycobacterium wuenschmannii TaxID=3027808 RepID=A0ABY8VYZ8_9MYCO|nr:MarR family winged helix-turn-helix transcriptional regulator [Candidatus Mycobacterium wuenschmannii]WIM88146.1 MarR family winged helix-turn-helix transcriptional regulator [Candidatus Mycobacterium wuenschmannii]